MKPIISGTLTAWDVGISTCTINFSWNGGLVAGNRLTIVETGLYHDTTGISKTYHTITPEIAKELGLKNGTTYHATITMINYDGIAVSETSQQFILKCYATPVFRINNLYDGIVLNASNEAIGILKGGIASTEEDDNNENQGFVPLHLALDHMKAALHTTE